MEHIALLQKELDRLRLNLDHAQRRVGVSQREIDNLRRNIRIKEDLVNALIGKKRYAVFTKMHATDYEPSPKWVQYCSWLRDESVIKERLEAARANPRFEAAKVLVEVKMYFDWEGFDVEESGV